MAKAKDFTDLEVWKTAHGIALSIYKTTRGFPADEKFGLVSQMRRAAVSIPSNIAEGFARRGKKEKINFYAIALGSLQELKYHLILSKDLGYAQPDEETMRSVEAAGMMLNKLISAIISS